MKKLALLFSIIVLASGICFAQTSAFTYQGKLGSSGAPATGVYQFEFKLFDADTGTNQIGSTQTVVATVTNGGFTTRLDFGATAFPTDADRWLEISVRLNGSGDAYTVLSPRQEINSVPFAVRSLIATSADNATNATTADTAGNVTGVVPIANGGTGSTEQNFVDLTNAQTVGGDKTFSNTLSGNAVNATTQYNIGGTRVLKVSGGGPITSALTNIFVGVDAGAVNAWGQNSFVGSQAGFKNTTGSDNSFVGYQAGYPNETGRSNSFFGRSAGEGNITGSNNTMMGYGAYVSQSDLNFATAIGSNAAVDSSNTVVLGRPADTVKIPGALTVTGAGSVGSLSVGGAPASAGTVSANIFSAQVSYNLGPARVLSFGGDTTGVFIGRGAGSLSVGNSSAFVGEDSGQNTTAGDNSFFGWRSGRTNISGTQNAFFGASAGLNSTGGSNTFVGAQSAQNNGGGTNNTVLGASADLAPGNFNNATAIGAFARVSQSSSLILGAIDGSNGGTPTNVGIGTTAPQSRLDVVGTPNKLIRTESSSTSGTWINLTNTGGGRSWNVISSGTANGEGAGKLMFFDETAFATRMTIDENGHVVINELGAAGSTSLCRNAANEISTCTPGNLPEQSGVENAATLGALREQLKQQQLVIDQLKAIVCTSRPDAAVCKDTNK